MRERKDTLCQGKESEGKGEASGEGKERCIKGGKGRGIK